MRESLRAVSNTLLTRVKFVKSASRLGVSKIIRKGPVWVRVFIPTKQEPHLKLNNKLDAYWCIPPLVLFSAYQLIDLKLYTSFYVQNNIRLVIVRVCACVCVGQTTTRHRGPDILLFAPVFSCK